MNGFTPEKPPQRTESPNYLQISWAAAITLGFVPGRFYRNAKLSCINTLLTYHSGCLATCAYCGLQKVRDVEYSKKSFIRVEWPTFRLDEIIERTKRIPYAERFCISQITHPRAVEDTKYVLSRVRRELGDKLFVSVLINATGQTYEDIEDYRRLGADTLTVAVDAATPELFERLRGRPMRSPHRWETYWRVLRWCVDVMGEGYVGCHLIVGLGETERQMVETIQKVRDLGGRTHLFSFWPEEGSLMEKERPCPAPQYRRVQMARYLIDSGITRYEDMKFNEREQIVDWGVSREVFEEVFWSGRPFMTSGCRGKTMEVACNRPFGDSPASDIKSYPFRPNRRDLLRIRRQMFDYGMDASYPDILNPSFLRYH